MFAIRGCAVRALSFDVDHSKTQQSLDWTQKIFFSLTSPKIATPRRSVPSAPATVFVTHYRTDSRSYPTYRQLGTASAAKGKNMRQELIYPSRGKRSTDVHALCAVISPKKSWVSRVRDSPTPAFFRSDGRSGTTTAVKKKHRPTQREITTQSTNQLCK